ncbi:class I adenylate-forming enzyme family protein [Rhodococcus sp. OK302]|uniref:class I adenylate-forming enzyme family protein n=1 Tax=Rhodococcus sp. OK302 TaxID=1882769 RepID=UPI000B943425|nr:class I adenylate-forming enzyme family protein [Rhodococcus sp. OK302]OYD70354.1 long-chain acyl-CoA synthetase [Rhodococcus sp. OK302]
MITSQRSGISFAPENTGTICAIEDDRALTWSELDDLSNRFGSSLERFGIRPGDVVAIRLHTRIEWLIVNLGIAKVGAIAVAVNFKLAPPESTYILKDCKVRAAIVDDADPTPLVEAWSELDLAAIITLDQRVAGAHLFEDLLTEGKPEARQADDFAPIIIYSSGTTGAPKGAPLGEWQSTPDSDVRRDYSLSVNFDGAVAGSGSSMLINLPMHHGAGPGYTRSTLLAGGMVIFQRRFDPEDVLRLIELHQVTHWIAVPTMLQRVLSLPEETRSHYDTSSMKFILGGAAPFAPHLKEQITDLFGEVLHEIYGCTEAGMMSGATPNDLRERPTTSGRAFRHVDLKIVDEVGTELPAGSTGEIVARTPVVIRGYIGRGPLESGKVLPGGFYRTGDVGHLDEDGYLYIYDRITDMVIAGGANIYPAEIEAVLDTHQDVELSAVVGVPHDELGEQPVAAIQLRPGASLTADELLSYCNGRLAKYKWPREFHFVDQIPVSPMGKLLKRELRKDLL